MGRKKKHEEHENLERWLVSYADFITLLFATFVVLYALSQLDLAKFKDMKISLAQAFAPTIFKSPPGPGPGMVPGKESVLPNDKAGMDGNNIIPDFNPNMEIKKAEEAKAEIDEAIDAGNLEGVDAKLDKRGLVISLVDSVFFAPGSAAVKAKAQKNLDKIALILKKKFPNNKIRIEGHTDSSPISTTTYPSNWELSGARASSVVRHFIKRYKMKKKTFSAVGYADSVPIDTNKTAEGRQKNRRVEIVILNSTTLKQENSSSSTFATAKHPTHKKTQEKDNPIQIIKGGKIKANISEVQEKNEEEHPPEGQENKEKQGNTDNAHTATAETEHKPESSTPHLEEVTEAEPSHSTETKAPPTTNTTHTDKKEENKHFTPIEMPDHGQSAKPNVEILEVERSRSH